MRFYTSDESGIIKGVEIDPKVSLLEATAQAAKRTRDHAKAKAVAKKGESVEAANNELEGIKVWNINGEVKREMGIQQTCKTTWEDGDRVVVVGRRNGLVESVSLDTGRSVFSYQEPDFASPVNIKSNGRFINERSYVGIGASSSHFTTCTNLGEVRYQSFTDNLNDEGTSDSALMMKLPVDVCRMKTHSSRPNIFAIGGREQELTIWDAQNVVTKSTGLSNTNSPVFAKAKSAPIFKSKNVSNDNLDLRVPVWITDMEFMNEDTSNPQMVVSTGYKQIRIYDSKAQQRPVKSWTVSKSPIYTIHKSHVKPELFFADNLGNVQQLDLRMGKVIGGYKGFAGAVKSIALSEDGSKLATAGLDRFVRVHETDGMRRMLHRAYVKQRVSHVIYDWESKDLAQDEIEQQEAEDIWDGMDVLGNEETSKKRKRRPNAD